MFVGVHFNKTNKRNYDDKMKRLILSDLEHIKPWNISCNKNSSWQKPEQLNLGYAGKREILCRQTGNDKPFLITDDDIIICDPEASIFPYCSGLTGKWYGYRLRARALTGSPVCEPMDSNLNYSEDDSPLRWNPTLSSPLCELVT